MANPQVLRPAPPNRSSPLRCIILSLFGILIVVGLIILIVYLIVRPARIEYAVENAQVHNYNLTSSNSLNATFGITLNSNNHNHRVSIYYDSIQVAVWYADQMLASADVSPFHQPKRNVTAIEVGPTARSVPLMGSVAERLRKDRTGGEAGFEVRVKARIRFKVGAIKSRHYNMKVYCPGVMVNFPPPKKTFDRVYCDVDI